MDRHFADSLMAAIEEKGSPICVGLDPRLDRLPANILTDYGPNDPLGAVRTYCMGVLQAVAPVAPIVKINIAYFEVFFGAGVSLYYELVHHAHELGMLVIGDIKRADVGHTAEMYAQAHLCDPPKSSPPKSGPPKCGPPDSDPLESVSAITPKHIPDAVTLNAYFGIDGLKPFIDAAETFGRGLFLLVQTSNPSAVEVQGLRVHNGETVCEHVAKRVEEWGSGLVGASGYSSIGAVAAPHGAESMRKLRDRMPHAIFLVPGFGAQGRTAEDVAPCFNSDGRGALIAASRSVIYAFEKDQASDWVQSIGRACREFADQVGVLVK